jgi:hypothetical protein
MRIVLGMVLLCLAGSLCLSEENGSPRETQDKTNGPQGNNQPNNATPSPSPPPNITFSPIIINVPATKKGEEQSQCTAPENWKEWGAFAWCRTWEWLDAEKIIAIFTVILGMATGFLWLATKNLVIGAEDTAERQLRAYVSISPSGVVLAPTKSVFSELIAS